MALDTALKRFSAMHVGSPWRGILPIPDGTVSQRDRQIVAFLYSGILATSPPTTAAITGTAIGATEVDIRAGGKTIIITLTNDTWVTAGATFNAQRQNILNGVASTSGIFIVNQPVTVVVRTSDTVVTLTLVADLAYDITATDTITDTVPSSALVTSALDVTATPTFTVSAIADGATSGGGGLDPGEGLRRRDLPAKPLGLPPKRKKKVEQAVEDRVEAAKEIHAEVQREASERLDAVSDSVGFEPINTMSAAQIHEEIRILLIRQQTKDDEDRMMLLLLAAGS